MSATITSISDGYDVWGKTRSKLVTILGDSSYPAGGYPVTPANIGLLTIAGAINAGSLGAAASGAYTPVWDQTAGKLRLWVSGSEVGTGQSVSTVQFNMLFLGN